MKTANRMLAAIAAMGAAAPAQEPAPDLQAQLEQAVDLPTAELRREAARELARERKVSVEEWLAAMRAFGRFEEVPAGPGSDAGVAAGGGAPAEVHYYVPQGYGPTTPAPLLVVLHDAAGSGRGMDAPWRETAEELGMLVLAPSQTGEHAGYAYTDEERDGALAALRWMRRRFNVDEDRVFLSGVSRGGHMCWDLALRNPDRFAALAPMIGGPRVQLVGGQNNLRYLESLWATPIRDLQGSGDDPGLLFNLRFAFERLEKLGNRDAELIEFDDLGHDFRFEAVDWKAFLGAARRDPAPERVVATCVEAEGSRSFWIEALKLEREVAEEFQLKVDPRSWNRLSNEKKKEKLQEEVDRRTARIEVEQRALGRFHAEARGATKIRILLTEEMFDPKKPVELRFGRRTAKKRLRPDARVLLEHFVERFDRGFLPVAALSAP